MRCLLMQTSYSIDLPQKEIADWHGRLLQKANQSADILLNICGASDAHESVKKLVGDPKISALLGAPPNGIRLENGHHCDYERWLFNLWGRRCSYYLSSLIDGLIAAQKINQTSELKSLIKDLETPKKRLAEHFKSWVYAQVTPESSLIKRHDIANFHVTYLDPVLFSSLYYLNRFRNDGHLQDKAKAMDKLWRLIKREVSLSTNSGNKTSDQVLDESTVWWGFFELVERDQIDFHLGKFERWKGVADICKNLMNSNYGGLRFPLEAETLREATPEIYGQIRTRTLIAKNCLGLVRLVPPKELAGIRGEFSNYIGSHINYVIGGFEQVSNHLSWIGINLELSSNAMQMVSAHDYSYPPPAPDDNIALKEDSDTKQKWIEILRGVVGLKSRINKTWLRLPSKIHRLLGIKCEDKWFAFSLTPKCLIAFPECLWESFWVAAIHKFNLTPVKVEALKRCCGTIDFNRQEDPKRGATYFSIYWIIPNKVMEQLDFSGQDLKVPISKKNFTCEISSSDFWLQVTPRTS